MTEAARPAPELESLPSRELLARLPEKLRHDTLDYMDWLLRITPAMTDPVELIENICMGLVALDVPLDRYRSSLTVNTADADAVGRVWVRGEGVRETLYVGPGRDDPEYATSPFAETQRTGHWVDLWLPDAPDDRFGIVPELKAAGYTHYLCIQLHTPAYVQGWLTLATRHPEGFSLTARVQLALVLPVLGTLINTRIARVTLDRLLRTYVGDEPHRAILDGTVKRGQVTTIRSAILFADMRDSTGHTAEISAVEAVALFNDFFDCLVPPIEGRGGEVLKYIGDGLLAIFRESQDGRHDAASRALAAAEDILANIAAANLARATARPIDLGIALHYGEAAYGNVGSGLRLDFTVIGRDIGFASRIGDLNGQIDEPILMSERFVTKLGHAVQPVGTYSLRGFATPAEVFRPLKGSAS